MRTNYSELKHNFDVFHLAKTVSLKLRKLFQKKGFEEIEACGFVQGHAIMTLGFSLK